MSQVLVLGQMWLFSGKSGCIRAKVVVFVQRGCFRTKWLYSESGCIPAKVVVLGQSDCIRANWLNSGNGFALG